jgi:choline dehydrogenase-like flavoprotein
VIPTSLAVNPSLTIAAVSERAAAHLVRRAHDFGLPKAPKGFRFRTPDEHVGRRVQP